jgi:hypothetical protein
VLFILASGGVSGASDECELELNYARIPMEDVVDMSVNDAGVGETWQEAQSSALYVSQQYICVRMKRLWTGRENMYNNDKDRQM